MDFGSLAKQVEDALLDVRENHILSSRAILAEVFPEVFGRWRETHIELAQLFKCAPVGYHRMADCDIVDGA